MALEYKIGKLNINVNALKCSKADAVKHGYIVESKGEELYLHVSANFLGISSHERIANESGVHEDDIVGGGSIYIDSKNHLVLDDLCEKYGTVPKAIAEKLAHAVLFDLGAMGIDVDGIKADPPQFCLNNRWKKQ